MQQVGLTVTHDLGPGPVIPFVQKAIRSTVRGHPARRRLQRVIGDLVRELLALHAELCGRRHYPQPPWSGG